VEPREGLELAVRLHRFWYMRGFLREGGQWLKELTERRGEVEDVLEIQAFNARGMLAGRQGQYAEARRHYERALEVARRTGDRRREAGILTNLGLLLEGTGQFADSRRFHEASLAVYRDLGDAVGVARVEMHIGVVAIGEGRFDEAASLIIGSLPVFVRNGDQQRVAASHHLLEAFRHSRPLDDSRSLARSMLWMAVIGRKSRHFEEAAVCLTVAEMLRDQVGVALDKPDPEEFRQTHDAIQCALPSAALLQARRRAAAMSLEEVERLLMTMAERLPPNPDDGRSES
jgi:tetratricopeptide (TPR) repeat protein